ncbi:hypothetical protein RABR111495_19020 [Rahnella bruchi]|uniref:DUF3289 family protein n=1 Tax=Rahnella bruchi TaxID=1510573 RepID=UPI000EA3F61A
MITDRTKEQCKRDVMELGYNSFRFFRIWFCLQLYNKMAFKPFVTEMELTIRITEGRP